MTAVGTAKKPALHIVKLDPGDDADVDGVAALHRTYLADSALSLFGERFLRDFYYRALVRDGLLHVTVCHADDQVVGFISYTEHPADFVSRGMRGHPLLLCWIMFLSVLSRPTILREVITQLRIARARVTEAASGTAQGVGEVASIVSVEKYRKYVPRGGRSRLTVRLFEEMVSHLRAAGIDTVHLHVQPDNKTSNLFCSAMGCEFAKVTLGGQIVHRYIYKLPAHVVSRDLGPR